MSFASSNYNRGPGAFSSGSMDMPGSSKQRNPFFGSFDPPKFYSRDFDVSNGHVISAMMIN